MKKVLLIPALFILCFVQAQEDQSTTGHIGLEKGTIILNSSLALSSSSQDESTSNFTYNTEINSYSIKSTLGYTIVNDGVIGLIIGYSSSDLDEEFNFEDNETENYGTDFNTFDIGAFGKKYFFLHQNFALNIQGEFIYSSSNEERTYIEPTLRKVDFDSFSVGVRPGLSYFMSTRFSIDAQFGFLGYVSSNRTSEFNDNPDTLREYDVKQFDFNLNTSNLFFGLSYYFNR